MVEKNDPTTIEEAVTKQLRELTEKAEKGIVIHNEAYTEELRQFAEVLKRNRTIINEARQQFPFLRNIQIKEAGIPLEISSSELDDEFLNQSLLEDESRAAGHPHVKKTLYVVRGDKLHFVDVKRTTREIWPPAYCHPDSEDTDAYHNDEDGESETVREALSRQDLTKAQYVVLYTIGFDYKLYMIGLSVHDYCGSERIHNILIAPVEK